MHIEIVSLAHNPLALKEELSDLLVEESIQFDLLSTRQAYRGLDPSIVVATISASSAVIGALISAIIALAKKSRSKTVKITGKSGRSIEVPADTSSDEIMQYIELTKELDDIKQISLY